MTRLPWEHGSTHRMHDEDGGESLNADVMRFVAILALCLAALFALVRGIPLAAPVASEAPAAPGVKAPEAVPDKPKRSEPSPSPEPTPSPPAQSPTPPAREAAPAPVEPPAPAPPAPTADPVEASRELPPAVPAEGFSLRFASDEALQRLIADGRIRVYARPEGGRWWVTARSRLPQFQPAAAPAQVYEMHRGTVPRAMLAALDRDRGLAVAGPVLWGVSLPPDMSTRINGLVEGRRGGDLVIDAVGTVTLQPQPEVAP